MEIENLTGLVFKTAVAVGNSATDVWVTGTKPDVTGSDEKQAKDIRYLRILIRNTGGAALTAAALNTSLDGTNWTALDGSAFTTAFGTLASSGLSAYLSPQLNVPMLKISLTCGTSTTVSICIIQIYS